MRSRVSSLFAAILLAVPGLAFASFHFMQIEQAIGGVEGDETQQAVQLRMRSGNQNLVQSSRLMVRDMMGANPVLLVDLAASVTNAAIGDRVLIASPGFVAAQGPAPDFMMTSLIPSAYLAGGRLTFEDDFGTVYFSLCWGSYIGQAPGSPANDADGEFAPCEPGALPSTTLGALQFGFTATAPSTNNADDFALTGGAAVFTNNARASAMLVEPPLFVNGFED